MSITPGSIAQKAPVGSTQTLLLVPLPPRTATQAAIRVATYAGQPSNATIAPDGLSITFTVIAGFNHLVITVISPAPNDAARLIQGTHTFATLIVSNHWASTDLLIDGTP